MEEISGGTYVDLLFRNVLSVYGVRHGKQNFVAAGWMFVAAFTISECQNPSPVDQIYMGFLFVRLFCFAFFCNLGLKKLTVKSFDYRTGRDFLEHHKDESLPCYYRQLLCHFCKWIILFPFMFS